MDCFLCKKPARYLTTGTKDDSSKLTSIKFLKLLSVWVESFCGCHAPKRGDDVVVSIISLFHVTPTNGFGKYLFGWKWIYAMFKLFDIDVDPVQRGWRFKIQFWLLNKNGIILLFSLIQ